VQGFEAGTDVGGTWYWNRYPGARCDSESLSYSYSFLPELDQAWHWPARYAEQPEILKYINHVATTLALRKHYRFSTRVTSASFDEVNNLWTVGTDPGDQVTASYLIMATGCLSKPNWPAIDGIEDFLGDRYHTGLWPHDGVDFSGKRVAVIGTGSTGIQSIPRIAQQAEQLFVFQRTANHCVPAHNAPMDHKAETTYKAHYAEMREKARHSISGDVVPEEYLTIMDLDDDTLKRELDRAWGQGGFYCQYPYKDLLTSHEANERVAEYSRNHIRARVKEPEVAERLCAQNHPFGTKRLCVAGFPNLFTVTGPGSPSVLTNMVSAIEQHVEWIDDCLAWMGERGASRIEATGEAQAKWVEYLNKSGDATLFPEANSWYVGANIPGKARVFMPYVNGLNIYRDECDAVANDSYAGFAVT
jgi:cyclohexanone monooxygenase